MSTGGAGGEETLGGSTFGAGAGVGDPGDGCGAAPVAGLTTAGLAVVAGGVRGAVGVETVELAFAIFCSG